MSRARKKAKRGKTPSSAQVLLVVPHGLDPKIYPWGVLSLADFLETSGAPARVHLLDLSKEERLAEIRDQHRELLGRLFELLKDDARSMFFGHTFNPDLFLGVVASTGPAFFELGRRNRLFTSSWLARLVERSCLDQLRGLKDSVEEHLTRRLMAARDGAAGGPRLWGLSVYDYTAFNCFNLASVIKRIDPEASVLLGGDYFDAESARVAACQMPWIDGVVTGYGEEVLRQVATAFAAGAKMRELEVPGLVCATREARPAGAITSNEINIPTSYKDTQTAPPINYVRGLADGTIRMLTQRGCAWGQCTFCTQIDRKLFFPIQLEHLLQRTRTLLSKGQPAEKSKGVRRILLDADENDLGTVLPIVQHLQGTNAERYLLEFWLMVRKFSPDFLRRVKAGNPNTTLRVLLNIESLSLDTLRHMHKGHSPLQALEAIKAMQDTGNFVSSNYFLGYPLEDANSVASEVELLGRAVHLLMPPQASLSGFPYAPNCRDAIFHEQEKYKISVRRLPGDVWMKEVFHVDLPFTIWAFSYDRHRPGRLPEFVTYTHHMASQARKRRMVGRIGSMILTRRKELSRRERLVEHLRHLDGQGWRLLHHAAQRLAGDEAYQRRAKIIQYLEDVVRAHAHQHAPSREQPPASPGLLGRLRHLARREPTPPASPSRLFIQDTRLIKDYHVPGAEASWSVPLEEAELRVLRFLYWRRRRAEIQRRFEKELGAQGLTELLQRHLQYSSVIEQKGWLLCVANDPSFWAAELEAWLQEPCQGEPARTVAAAASAGA